MRAGVRETAALWLEKRARRMAAPALFNTAVGFIIWPLLPVGVAYTAGMLGAHVMAKAIRFTL